MSLVDLVIRRDMTIENAKLIELASRLHRMYGAEFHSPVEAMLTLQSILTLQPDIEIGQLRQRAAEHLGNGKQHAMGAHKTEDQPIQGFVKPPRKSRRKLIKVL